MSGYRLPAVFRVEGGYTTQYWSAQRRPSTDSFVDYDFVEYDFVNYNFVERSGGSAEKRSLT